jgi:hypothetical protein
MATENEHIQLTGGIALVHRNARNQLEQRLGFEPRHARVYSHLIEHYDGPLDLPNSNSRE